MTGTVFVDTNVLVYARDGAEPEKQRAAARWMAELWATRRGRLSVQVLQEYYVTATRKLDPPRSRDSARADVVALHAWGPVPVDLVVLERAWALEGKYGFSWWDAQILGAALAARCTWLLTEDLQDGQDVEGLRVVNPFVHEVEEFLRPEDDGPQRIPLATL